MIADGGRPGRTVAVVANGPQSHPGLLSGESMAVPARPLSQGTSDLLSAALDNTIPDDSLGGVGRGVLSMQKTEEIGQSIVAGGVVTNYHEAGQGFPVILIHGSGPGVSAWANWSR